MHTSRCAVVGAAGAEPFRKRLDMVTKPDGTEVAIVTITLPGGIVKRFSASADPNEAAEVSGDIVGAELALRGPSVGGVSIFKKVGRLAKKVATSKVFALAAKGLAFAAPLLGPAAPFALAAGAGLGVASKLAKAGVAAAHGAKGVAAALTQAAAKDAKRLTSTPQAAASLLADANKTRLGADKIIDKTAPDKPQPKSAAPKPAAAAPSSRSSAAPSEPSSSTALAARSGTEADLLARARAGRVSSNSGAPVNATQLLAAHREGRIYWVA